MGYEKKELMPPTYFCIALVLMLLLHILLPLGIWLTPLGRVILGVSCIVVGGALAAGGKLTFDHHRTPVKPFEKPAILVTSGPFSFSRNPMYLGLIIVLFGAAFCLGSILPLLVTPAFIYLIRVKFILREEKMLEEIFGEEYREYTSIVRRWV